MDQRPERLQFRGWQQFQRLYSALLLTAALAYAQAPHGSLDSMTFMQPETGAGQRSAEAKARDIISALDFPGVDATGATDSTAGLRVALAAATSAGGCLYIPRGVYKVFNASGFASVVLGPDACVRGEGWKNTKIVQYTTNGTTLAVQGDSVHIRDLMITRAAGVAGGIGISIYPDVTSTVSSSYTKIDNVAIYAADCADSDSACQSAANANRLSFGILIQSGKQDTIDAWIIHNRIRWAAQGIEAISGGLAGSAFAGAAQANWFTDDWISDSTNAVSLISSGENFFPSLQCTNASEACLRFGPQTAGVYTGFQSSNNMGSVQGEADSAYVDFGNIGDYVSVPSQGNKVTVMQNEIDAGPGGNFSILGSAQNLNEIDIPAIAKSGFTWNSTNPTYSADPFWCIGMVDDLNQPCGGATFDARSSANIKNIFRFRNGSATATSSDWVNWNPFNAGGGFQWQVDNAYSLTDPIHTIYHPNSSAQGSSISYLLFNAHSLNMGGVTARYYNQSVSAVRTVGLFAYDSSGAIQYPLWARGDGGWGNSLEPTVGTLPGCNSTIPPLGSLQMDYQVSDLSSPTLGASAVGGGSTHGKVYCDGGGWKVLAANVPVAKNGVSTGSGADTITCSSSSTAVPPGGGTPTITTVCSASGHTHTQN